MHKARQLILADRTTGLPDLDSGKRIAAFVSAFYGRMLTDEILGEIFLDVARVQLSEHLPRICQYWEKLLLGKDRYHRHTMNIHRALNAQKPLGIKEFRRWLELFHGTVDEHFHGPMAERAKRIASTIAANMQQRLAEHAAERQPS